MILFFVFSDMDFDKSLQDIEDAHESEKTRLQREANESLNQEEDQNSGNEDENPGREDDSPGHDSDIVLGTFGSNPYVGRQPDDGEMEAEYDPADEKAVLVEEDKAALEANLADDGPGLRARANFVKRGHQDSPPSPNDKAPIVNLFPKDEKSSEASKFVSMFHFKGLLSMNLKILGYELKNFWAFSQIIFS